MAAVILLFGCEQCRPPSASDLSMLWLGLWTLLVFAIVLIAALNRERHL